MDIYKKYLITGGSGFLGKKLIERLLGMGCENIRVVARNEGQLVALQERYPTIQVITGNIADKLTADKACSNVDAIFHLAAYKHVNLAEDNVSECVSSNVQGTMNILEASRKYEPAFVIGISTDKASRVSGIYGATKLLMEGLFREYEKLNLATKYRVVRYGNVAYSTGSVMCKWRDRLIRGAEVTVTNLDATRFFWTVDEAVDLIFDCLENATDSKPRVKDMKALRIGDLLDCMAEKYLPIGKELRVRNIGMQRGDNLHEVILENGTDSSKAPRYTKEEIMSII